MTAPPDFHFSYPCFAPPSCSSRLAGFSFYAFCDILYRLNKNSSLFLEDRCTHRSLFFDHFAGVGKMICFQNGISSTLNLSEFSNSSRRAHIRRGFFSPSNVV